MHFNCTCINGPFSIRQFNNFSLDGTADLTHSFDSVGDSELDDGKQQNVLGKSETKPSGHINGNTSHGQDASPTTVSKKANVPKYDPPAVYVKVKGGKVKKKILHSPRMQQPILRDEDLNASQNSLPDLVDPDDVILM